MRRAGVAVLLLITCSAITATAQEITDWRDAGRCVGRVCAVRGRIAATEIRGNVVRLYFDAVKRDVSVVLVRGWLSDFPEHPDDYYRGNEVIATGPVRRFHDQIEIVSRAREDVQLVGKHRVAEKGSAALGAQSEIDALEVRVRSLERRVEQLEKHRAP